MCEKCVAIDAKIDHYHRLSRFVTDRPTVEGIQQLVAQMMSVKLALHPAQAT